MFQFSGVRCQPQEYLLLPGCQRVAGADGVDVEESSGLREEFEDAVVVSDVLHVAQDSERVRDADVRRRDWVTDIRQVGVCDGYVWVGQLEQRPHYGCEFEQLIYFFRRPYPRQSLQTSLPHLSKKPQNRKQNKNPQSSPTLTRTHTHTNTQTSIQIPGPTSEVNPGAVLQQQVNHLLVSVGSDGAQVLGEGGQVWGGVGDELGVGVGVGAFVQQQLHELHLAAQAARPASQHEWGSALVRHLVHLVTQVIYHLVTQIMTRCDTCHPPSCDTGHLYPCDMP